MLYLEVTVRWLILKQYLEVTVQNPITGMGECIFPDYGGMWN